MESETLDLYVIFGAVVGALLRKGQTRQEIIDGIDMAERGAEYGEQIAAKMAASNGK